MDLLPLVPSPVGFILLIQNSNTFLHHNQIENSVIYESFNPSLKLENSRLCGLGSAFCKSLSVSNQQEEQGQDSNSWILGGWTFNCCFSFINFGPKNENPELSPSPICVCWLFVPAELGAGRLTNGIDHRNLFLQNSNFAQNAAFQRRDFYTFDLHIYICVNFYNILNQTFIQRGHRQTPAIDV